MPHPQSLSSLGVTNLRVCTLHTLYSPGRVVATLTCQLLVSDPNLFDLSFHNQSHTMPVNVSSSSPSSPPPPFVWWCLGLFVLPWSSQTHACGQWHHFDDQHDSIIIHLTAAWLMFSLASSWAHHNHPMGLCSIYFNLIDDFTDSPSIHIALSVESYRAPSR